MEKQGMDRRRRLFRFGLLIHFTLSFFLLPLFPGGGLKADEEETLELQVETSPLNPIVNSPWSVYIMVKHPNPREVAVEPPRFPSFLALERVRMEVRTMEQGERWTRVEYLFTPLRAETITLESFEIKTPSRRGLSPAINVSFNDDTSRRRYEPRFRWLGSAPSIASAEKGELILELINWDPLKKIPQGFFQGRAPLNAILEEAPPFEVREGVFRYTISLIPLEYSDIKLEPISFQSDIYTLTIPEINIPVRPPRPGRFETSERTQSGAISADQIRADNIRPNEIRLDEFEKPMLPFSQLKVNEKVFFLFRVEYNQIVSRVEALWTGEKRAEALAELRRNERDSLSGPFLIPLRREMESVLDLGFTADESWSPLKIPAAFWIFFGVLILSAVLFFLALRTRKGNERVKTAFRKGGGFAVLTVLIIVAALAYIFLEESVGSLPVGPPVAKGKAAILRKTEGYRIPDFKGLVSDHFEEGQPVIVGDYRENWSFAETPDGRSGWVPGAAVIPY